MPGKTAMMPRLGRDYAYLLPGLPVAVFSFSLLLVLTVTAAATLVVWIGALLLPVTLLVATGFAELDRTRLRRWGETVASVNYRPYGPGFAGKLRIAADPRRWLDLVFEMLIAFPLRLTVFVLAVVWTAVGPAGITYFFWSVFIPGERGAIQLLRVVNPELLPQGTTAQYLLDVGLYFLLGVISLLTLPAVIRALARLDASVSVALLGTGEQAATGGQAAIGAKPQHSETHQNTTTQPRPGREPGRIHAHWDSGGRSVSTGSFSPQAWSGIGAGFAAVVLLAVGWPVVAAIYSLNAAVAMVIVVAHCAAVVLTLRFTWAGLGLSLAAAAATMWATAPAEVVVWPWPVTTMITQCAVLLVAALARPWYYAAGAWGTGAGLTLAVLLISAPDLPAGALATGIVFVSTSAAVVLIGVLVRIWIRRAGQLQEATRTSAEQGRRRRELEERSRIARELHDVVAHSMSVISVQATTAQYRNATIDEDARREFDEIAASSRQALNEMRMLLTILRGADPADTAPEPDLADIDALIESTRSSGTNIRYSPTGEDSAERRISSSTGLIAYRTVQEALSNALRHASGASIEVNIGLHDDAGRSQLTIEVVNSAPPQSASEPLPGAGFGLKGIRERVEAVGGSVQAAPTEEGGFALRANLPA